MRGHILRTVSLVAICLGLAAVAPAQDHPCSHRDLVGAWGYTETGTVINITVTPPVPIVAAAVGRYDFGAAGNFSGTQYSSAGGNVSHDTNQGKYKVNPDCTGTLTLDVFNKDGQQVRHSVWAIVLVDNATEIRGIMLSMQAPDSNGIFLPPILTMTARRLLGDRDRDER